jgi:hypothetical protein
LIRQPSSPRRHATEGTMRILILVIAANVLLYILIGSGE